MKKSLLFTFIFLSIFQLSAQMTATINLESEEADIKILIESFLTAAGNYDVNAMPEMFTEKANISGASFRNGKWTTFTMTLLEFLEAIKSENNPTLYTEPVSKYTIHIEEGMLAFVKADAILKVDGKSRKNNFDYFTLIKEDGFWKILNGSYVSVPIE